MCKDRSLTRIWAGLCLSEVLCKNMYAMTLSKSFKLFEEKNSVYENSPLSTCASFPKQPQWKLCSLFELEINSSIKATHTHKLTESFSNIHFSQITFIQPILASITSIWACVNLQRNTSSNIPSKPTNLQPLVLFLLDAPQTSFWRKETGASVDSGRFWQRERSQNYSVLDTGLNLMKCHISSQNGHYIFSPCNSHSQIHFTSFHLKIRFKNAGIYW